MSARSRSIPSTQRMPVGVLQAEAMLGSETPGSPDRIYDGVFEDHNVPISNGVGVNSSGGIALENTCKGEAEEGRHSEQAS